MGRGSSKLGGGGGNARGSRNAPIDLTTATAAQISNAIDATDDFDELNNIIETIANNDVISNAEYTSLYQKALTKVQNQQPNNPGVEVKDIQNATLKTTMQDAIRDISMGKTYTYARSQRDGKVIDKNTSTGDIFTFDTASYTKIGANQWMEVGNPGHTFESDGMARIIAGLSGLQGKWHYKKA